MSEISYSYDTFRDDMSNKRKKVFDGASVLPFSGDIWLDYKGRLNFLSLYKRMFEKVKQMGYQDTDNGGENIEDYYYENRFPDGTKGEIQCWWRASRTPDNNLFRYRIHIYFQCLLIREETVVINGKKVKINDGEVNMFFSPILENFAKNEVAGAIKNSLLSERTNNWWYQSIYKKHEEAAKLEMFADILELYSTAKQFLGMESFVKVRTEFHSDWNVPKEE